MHARIEPEARGVELGSALPFALGDVQVTPAARQLAGPLAAVTLEPRVMQLLVALAERPGEVAARDLLLERCWAGMVVGEDSLNRAVAGLRRGLKEAGSAVAVETVPRVGYRLAGPLESPPAAEAQEPAGGGTAVSRRGVLVGVGALALVAAGGLAWRQRQSTARAALLRDADALLWTGNDADGFRARGMLEQALADDPGDARLWGLLAVARTHLAERAAAENVVPLRGEAAQAVAQALALDPLEGNALAARAMRDPLFGNWVAAGERLREVAAKGVATEALLNWQSRLAASMGRMEEALLLCDRVLALNPRNAFALRWRSHGLWAAGRIAEAEQAARYAHDRSESPRISLTLQWLLAHTGRAAEAEAAIRAELAGYPNPSRFLESRLLSTRALHSGRTEDMAAAEAALLDMARMGGDQVYLSMLELGALGRLDPAFALARQWFFDAPGLASAAERLSARYRRQTASLFLPPLAAMRADPRFMELMRAIGLLRAWTASGARPDWLKGRMMPV